MKVKISEIEVKSERYRKEFGDISELALSISKIGLLHPIIVTKDKVLVAGERRLRAHKELGLEEIEVNFIDDSEVVKLKEIEIEENIKRKQFTWQEELAAKDELHHIKQEIYGSAIKGHGGGWGIKDTASALGESSPTISRDLNMAKYLKEHPELGKLKSKDELWKEMNKQRERELVSHLGGIVKLSVNRDCIVHGNSAYELAKLDDASVDLICTDPPFAIGFDKMNFSDGAWKGAIYDDAQHVVFDELDMVIKNCFRILRPDRHAYFFFGVQFYAIVRQLLEKSGFQVNPQPNIWHKTGGSGTCNSDQNYASNYEPYFICYKGHRKLNKQGESNVQSIPRVPPQRKIHPAEKPKQLLRYLIEQSTLPGETVVDPYAGSGSTLLAGIECKRKVWGCEKDDTNYKNIILRLEELEKEINS